MSSKPTGLPELRGGRVVENAIENPDVYICEKCGQRGRAVSNDLGVNVHCGPCKRSWPVSMTPLNPAVPETLGRGIRKQTMVEPNWDLAYDSVGGDSDETIRRRHPPKTKKGSD